MTAERAVRRNRNNFYNPYENSVFLNKVPEREHWLSFLFMYFIGINDIPDQFVTYNVGFVKMNKAYPFDIFKDVL